MRMSEMPIHISFGTSTRYRPIAPNTRRRKSTSALASCDRANQLADVSQPVDGLNLLQRSCNTRRRHRQLRAIGELGVELRLRERLVGSAAIAFVGGLNDRAAVGEIGFDDAADFVEALRLDLRIENTGDARHH